MKKKSEDLKRAAAVLETVNASSRVSSYLDDDAIGPLLYNPVSTTMDSYIRHKACGRISLSLVQTTVSFIKGTLSIMLGVFASQMINNFVQDSDLKDYNYFLAFLVVLSFCVTFVVLLTLLEKCSIEKMGASGDIIEPTQVDYLNQKLKSNPTLEVLIASSNN